MIVANDENGLILEGTCSGSPASLCTTASKYAKGCTMVDSTTGLSYINIGTSASPSWRNGAGIQHIGLRAGTIATTGNSDEYIVCHEAGSLTGIDFSALAALATDETNYLTWTLTNLGQAGAGSTVMLSATGNTTKTTGGSAIAANTRRQLAVSGTAANLVVAAGDRLLLRVAASGTLANTVTNPVYVLHFTATS